MEILDEDSESEMPTRMWWKRRKKASGVRLSDHISRLLDNESISGESVPLHDLIRTVQPDFEDQDYSSPQFYHIAIAAGADYPGLKACLHSLFSHQKTDNMRLHLITSVGNTDRIQGLLDCLKPKGKTRIYELNEDISLIYNRRKEHDKSVEYLYSVQNYVKIYTPHIVSRAQKLLMLDADTIIVDDLMRFFELHLKNSEHATAAGAYGPVEQFSWVFNKFRPEHVYQGLLGVSEHTLNNYFSAGVMLVKPAQWRKLRLTQVAEKLLLLNQKVTFFALVTQGLINLIHPLGSVEYMQRKWNWDELGGNKLDPRLFHKLYVAAQPFVSILHFSGPEKPWKVKERLLEPFATWEKYNLGEKCVTER